MNTQIILALDSPKQEEALNFLKRIGSELTWVKVGLNLFTRYGPDFIHRIADLGYNIFLDLKFHDIPNTVDSALESISTLPIQMLTLHTLGGPEMLTRAHQARSYFEHPVTLLGVTILTSMDETQLKAIQLDRPASQQVPHLANLAKDSGLDGIVCSPQELSLLGDLPKDFAKVTPGIRLKDSASDDQVRIATPELAAQSGATHLVIGRPLLHSTDPQATLATIQNQISKTVSL